MQRCKIMEKIKQSFFSLLRIRTFPKVGFNGSDHTLSGNFQHVIRDDTLCGFSTKRMVRVRDGFADVVIETDSSLDQSQLLVLIEEALIDLPARQREAFLMRHVEDLSYEDIAAATGVGLSALRMRVKRACDALRTRLTQIENEQAESR